MKPIGRIFGISLACLGLAASTRADVITEWNDRAIAAGYAASVIPPAQARNVAIVAVAMFDAVNAIEPRYRPYRVQRKPEPGTSPDAAAAAAAHVVLVRMYPSQAKELDAAFQASLDAVADATARAAGVRLGESVGTAILEERSSDGADAANVYRPDTRAGVYVSTVLPTGSSWGRVRPFALERGDQFRPPAPYALSSAEWAADYNEVKKLGASKNSQRSAEQTEVARFWEFVGPGTYAPAVRQLAEHKRGGVVENARLYALAFMAAADALIAVFDAKYTYNFWRPVTAIRNGDRDGNDATERDPGWEPFIATPLHPEYPCAHCITQSAVATALGSIGGADLPAFSITSPTAPGVTRRYARLDDYVEEVVTARVFDGVHYRTSGRVGAEMGRRIGAHVVGSQLTPVPRGAGP